MGVAAAAPITTSGATVDGGGLGGLVGGTVKVVVQTVTGVIGGLLGGKKPAPSHPTTTAAMAHLPVIQAAAKRTQSADRRSGRTTPCATGRWFEKVLVPVDAVSAIEAWHISELAKIGVLTTGTADLGLALSSAVSVGRSRTGPG